MAQNHLETTGADHIDVGLVCPCEQADQARLRIQKSARCLPGTRWNENAHIKTLKITEAEGVSLIISSIVVADAMLQPQLNVDFAVMGLIVHYIESIILANRKR